MEWTFGWWQVSVQRVYPTSTELSQTYNHAAIWWHQHLHWLGYRRAYQVFWKSLQDRHLLPSWQNHPSICDCGIGTAAFSLTLAQSLNTSPHITGIDLSTEMLNQAHQRLTQEHISHQMVQGDVYHLPFVEGHFDGVICAHMLEHLPDPLAGLKEMYRVLRSGAPLILVVTRSGLPGTLIQWHWGNRCFSQQELVDLMKDSGFSNIQLIAFPSGLARLTSFGCIGYRE